MRGVYSFSLASVFLFGLYLFYRRFIARLGAARFPWVLFSTSFVLFRYFTTLTLMGRVLLFGIASFFAYFGFFFLFLWDRSSVYPFRRGIFILFVSLVFCSCMFIWPMLRAIVSDWNQAYRKPGFESQRLERLRNVIYFSMAWTAGSLENRCIIFRVWPEELLHGFLSTARRASRLKSCG